MSANYFIKLIPNYFFKYLNKFDKINGINFKNIKILCGGKIKDTSVLFIMKVFK